MGKNTFTLYFILCLNAFLVVTAAHWKCKRRQYRNFTKETTTVQPLLLEEAIVDNHDVNCSVLPNPKLIINPYKQTANTIHLKPKNISTVCLRCAACLAVADKLKMIVSETMDAKPSKDPVEVAEILRDEGVSICNTSFKSYDLRKFENDIILTDIFSATTHLSSEFDYKWPVMLKNMCHLFLEKIDFLRWYEDYIEDILDITDELCRNEGLFRDCTNMNYHYVILGDNYDYLAICTCSCASKDKVY